MNIEEYMIPCLSKTLFGVDCLGCGFQRALLLLLQGNYMMAFERYPAVYSMLAMFAGILIFYSSKNNCTKRLLNVLIVINLFFVVGGYLYKHFQPHQLFGNFSQKNIKKIHLLATKIVVSLKNTLFLRIQFNFIILQLCQKIKSFKIYAHTKVI